MSAQHFWFRSGKYFLLGHVDAPEKQGTRMGVVIVPPFGWEDVCSYRPLRFMAQSFAQAGIPTLRYDLPGTGDSSGDAQDAGLFDAWVQSVADAATELRRQTGVENVAAFGIHLGAMLALTAASRGADLQRLVLWGPAAKGRTLLRELRAAANVERWEYLAGENAPPQPQPGFEAGGFLISPETLNALENLDLSKVPLPRFTRALLLSRDELLHDATLVGPLETSGQEFEIATGYGYGAMMAAPQEAEFPAETCGLVTEFLTRATLSMPVYGPRDISPRESAVERPDAVESVYPIEPSSLGMFGILTQPDHSCGSNDTCVIFLNPGGVRHTGPNRMWVESARRWAARGTASLRLDLEGIGESDGAPCLDVAELYRDCLVEQIGFAIETLRRRSGMKKFVLVGLCSGACWGFHAAVRNPDICGAVLVNPSLLFWDPGVDRRRILPSVTSGWAGWSGWARMVGSGLRRGGVQRAAHAIAERLGRTNPLAGGYIQLGFDSVEQAWSGFEKSRQRVTLVFRAGEPLLTEMAAAGELPPSGSEFTRLIQLPNGGHTFRPLWAQKALHALIDDELTRAIYPVQSVPVSRAGENIHLSPAI